LSDELNIVDKDENCCHNFLDNFHVSLISFQQPKNYPSLNSGERGPITGLVMEEKQKQMRSTRY
jgi:hypothetical protein